MESERTTANNITTVLGAMQTNRKGLAWPREYTPEAYLRACKRVYTPAKKSRVAVCEWSLCFLASQRKNAYIPAVTLERQWAEDARAGDREGWCDPKSTLLFSAARTEKAREGRGEKTQGRWTGGGTNGQAGGESLVSEHAVALLSARVVRMLALVREHGSMGAWEHRVGGSLQDLITSHPNTLTT